MGYEHLKLKMALGGYHICLAISCWKCKKLSKLYPKYTKKAFEILVTGDETREFYFDRPKRSNRIWASKNAKRPSC